MHVTNSRSKNNTEEHTPREYAFLGERERGNYYRPPAICSRVYTGQMISIVLTIKTGKTGRRADWIRVTNVVLRRCFKMKNCNLTILQSDSHNATYDKCFEIRALLVKYSYCLITCFMVNLMVKYFLNRTPIFLPQIFLLALSLSRLMAVRSRVRPTSQIFTVK